MIPPITNEEKYLSAFLAAAGGQQVSLPEPVTRQEKFLYAMSHKDYQPPKPITREEKFMLEVIEYIRTHGGTVTHTVSYYNYDGTELLYSETVVDGEDAAGYEGETPSKPETEQYTYSFVGWSETAESSTADIGVLENITADKSVYAAFEPVEKTFTVTFYNGASVVYTALNVAYNRTAVYGGATPTKESTQQYNYNFIGWNTDSSASTADADALKNVTANRTVYAIFEQVARGYTVYFYDGETLLQTVQNVPYGGTATFTGTEPTKEDYQFTGWLPSPTNITADTACYAQFEPLIDGLITDDWATISSRSAAGTAANYYSVGDCKAVDLKGTMGTLSLDTTLYVYILGFDHNISNGESRGITFGGFKTDVKGTDVALCDSHYGSNSSDGSKWLNMSHWGNYNYGGWKGSDMRYDILGSTNVQPSGYGLEPTTSKVGYDATSTCATTPVANTLMSCLPSDLRSVMKPMTKYTDNKGNSSNVEANVTTSIDYLPLLSEYEVQGTRTYANQYEQSKQRQYTYYSDGNSKIKYNHSSTSSAVAWWVRSPYCSSRYWFCYVSASGDANYTGANNSRGVAPAFLI